MYKLSAAIVGFGYWGPNLLRNLFKHPNISVNYICDLSSSQLKKARIAYPEITQTKDFREIVNDSNINCVVIAVPTNEHFRISKEFILSGKNVLVEKPMTKTFQEAKILVNLARKKGVVLCVDHPYIFSEPIKKIKSLIDKNYLGKLYYYNSIRANLGMIDQLSNVFVDLAPHDLSILDYLRDKEEPEIIYALGSSHILHNHLKYVESGTLFLKYKNGFIANVSLSWLSPIKTRHITIAGNKKMLVYNDTNINNKLQIYDSRIDILHPNQKRVVHIKYRVGKIMSPKVKSNEPLYEVIDSFVKAILYKKSALNDGESGLRVVKIMERINKQVFAMQ